MQIEREIAPTQITVTTAKIDSCKRVKRSALRCPPVVLCCRARRDLERIGQPARTVVAMAPVREWAC